VQRTENERLADHGMMENHLYQCIYNVLRSDTPEAEKFLILKRYKAKIVCLHARRREKLLLDTDAKDKMDGEEPTLFHALRQFKLVLRGRSAR